MSVKIKKNCLFVVSLISSVMTSGCFSGSRVVVQNGSDYRIDEMNDRYALLRQDHDALRGDYGLLRRDHDELQGEFRQAILEQNQARLEQNEQNLRRIRELMEQLEGLDERVLGIEMNADQVVAPTLLGLQGQVNVHTGNIQQLTGQVGVHNLRLGAQEAHLGTHRDALQRHSDRLDVLGRNWDRHEDRLVLQGRNLQAHEVNLGDLRAQLAVQDARGARDRARIDAHDEQVADQQESLQAHNYRLNLLVGRLNQHEEQLGENGRRIGVQDEILGGHQGQLEEQNARLEDQFQRLSAGIRGSRQEFRGRVRNLRARIEANEYLSERNRLAVETLDRRFGGLNYNVRTQRETLAAVEGQVEAQNERFGRIDEEVVGVQEHLRRGLEAQAEATARLDGRMREVVAFENEYRGQQVRAIDLLDEFQQRQMLILADQMAQLFTLQNQMDVLAREAASNHAEMNDRISQNDRMARAAQAGLELRVDENQERMENGLVGFGQLLRQQQEEREEERRQLDRRIHRVNSLLNRVAIEQLVLLSDRYVELSMADREERTRIVTVGRELYRAIHRHLHRVEHSTRLGFVLPTERNVLNPSFLQEIAAVDGLVEVNIGAADHRHRAGGAGGDGAGIWRP